MEYKHISVRLNMDKPEERAIAFFWEELRTEHGYETHRNILVGLVQRAFPAVLNEYPYLFTRSYAEARLVKIEDLPTLSTINEKIASGHWVVWYTVPDYAPSRGKVYRVERISFNPEGINGKHYEVVAGMKIPEHENRTRRKLFNLTSDAKLRVYQNV